MLTGLQKGSFGTLWCLRVLLLKDNNISNVADGAFANLQKLRKLDLSYNCLAVLGPSFSLGLESLTELLLDHNHLTRLDSGTFSCLDNLQKLDLSSNLISTVKPRALGYLTSLRQLHLEANHLTSLASGLFSTLRSLEVLDLRGNLIKSTEPGTFSSMPSLNLLDLTHNRLGTLSFRTLLSVTTPSVHVLLEGNPWHCDCDLQRVFRKLCSTHTVFLDDYRGLRCSTPLGLKGRSMGEVDDELCVGETVTVLILTVTVVITVVAAIVMAEKNKKNSVAKDCEESVGLDTYYDNEN
ncbi:hypothetical protein DPEC_G00045320 [Dallia pectoralis]|uniref:Uncharacterized protein n=1 Tax=Dallia pectoralis TaxID=75939 RepID=A0ACC2HA66_DALPE|nr:hypothetical protein DPEC_G00045320 [Dallia pectoralis]